MIRMPAFVALDVIETTFSLAHLAPYFEAIGLPADDLDLWFARSLRDFFALSATDAFRPFPDVLEANLAAVGRRRGRDLTATDLQKVLAELPRLPPQPDAAEALAVLREAGIRCIALTNGTPDGTRQLFERAGLSDAVERIFTVEEVGLGKPRREVYLHAALACGVIPLGVCMIAAHPWDIHGAAAAGLATAYVARSEVYPPFLYPPDVTGGSLLEVARILAGGEGVRWGAPSRPIS